MFIRPTIATKFSYLFANIILFLGITISCNLLELAGRLEIMDDKTKCSMSFITEFDDALSGARDKTSAVYNNFPGTCSIVYEK